jgi:SAM-dependent methyltransferase
MSMPDLVEEAVPLDGRDLRLLRPRDAESLLDEEAFASEEFLPYWADLWPSARALAASLSCRALRGARTLELGCGLGLPSIAAALAGGRVLAVDWSPEAVELTRTNAERNGAELDTLVCSWTEPAPLLESAPWDLVIAADVSISRGHDRLPPHHSRTRSADSSSGSTRTPPGAPRSAWGVTVPSSARASRTGVSRRLIHRAVTGTPRAWAIRSTDPTLGRARPRSSWLRKGCERPASAPNSLSVIPRSRRSCRTRAPREAAVSSLLIPCSLFFNTPEFQSNGGSASVRWGHRTRSVNRRAGGPEPVGRRSSELRAPT